MVWLDGHQLLLCFTLQQPIKAHHISLLLHMSLKLGVLLGSNDVSHILGPVLIHLHSQKRALSPM